MSIENTEKLSVNVKVGDVVQVKLPTAPLMVIQRINESNELSVFGSKVQSFKLQNSNYQY